MPIQDFDTTVAVIEIPESYNVEDVDVGVTLEHTWVRDLAIWLERDSTYDDSVFDHQDSTIQSIDTVTHDTTYQYFNVYRDTTIDSVARVLLLDLFPADNIVNMTGTWFDDQALTSIYDGLPPFTGGFQPLRNIDTVFAGHDAQGQWRLVVYDRFAGDVGQLLDFSLEINGAPAITGTVSNSVTASPIANATVFLIDTSIVDTTGADTIGRTTTNADGEYVLSRIADGTYRMAARATNYLDAIVDGVTVMEGQTTTQNLQMVPTLTFTDVTYFGRAVTIPDAAAGRAEVDLEVTGIDSTILDLDVTVNITHTFMSDLIISLAHPNGDTITLYNPPGGVELGADMVNCRFDDQAATPIGSGMGPYTGSFVPEQPLSTFNGLAANGTWSLHVEDFLELDSGQVNNYTLHFQTPLLDADDRGIGLPQAFKLHPAYPNPFNSTVNLSLDVLREQTVTLEVFDITGRLVETLHSGKLTAGSHKFFWTANRVSSGMYFVRARTTDLKQTVKIVLLK